MNDDILALLETGPERTGQLARWLQTPESTMRLHLRAMQRDGLVISIGAGPQTKWALTAASSTEAQPVRIAKPALRHPTERPSSIKIAKGDDGSWWVKHAAPDARASFAKAAADRHVEMSEKSPEWRRFSPKGLPTTDARAERAGGES